MKTSLKVISFLILLFSLTIVCKKNSNQEITNIGIVNSRNGIKLYFEPNLNSEPTHLAVTFGAVISIIESIPPEPNRGVWTKIRYQDRSGWAYIINDNILVTRLIDSNLFANNLKGVTVYVSHTTESKKYKILHYGEKVHLLTQGFQNPVDAKFYNIAKIGTEYGFVLDDEFTSVTYTKEELNKAPFVGMIYRGSIHNCKSYYSSVVRYKGDAWEEKFYISREKCRNKEYILLSESLRYIGNQAEFKILNMIDTATYETDSNKHLVIGQFGIDELHCTGPEFTNTVSLIDIKKGTKTKNPDGSIVLENGILKTWILDQKSNNIIVIDSKDQKCISPSPVD